MAHMDGDMFANVMLGGGMDDTIHPGAGNDHVSAGNGDDVVDDSVSHQFWSIVDGVYVLNPGIGSGGNDTVFGGNGDDWLNGHTGNDRLFGDSGNDTVYGGDGHDQLDGGTGDDYLSGGAGNDAIRGGGGIDTAYGGSGNDTITSSGRGYYDAGDGSDYVYAGVGTPETLRGGAGNDVLNTSSWNGNYVIDLAGVGNNTNYANESFTQFEHLVTGNGNDRIYGTSGANRISSGGGNDLVVALGGNDTVWGRAGNDTIVGGSGADVLDGGSGADRFDYNFTAESPPGAANCDVITGFENGIDEIDLRDIDPTGVDVDLLGPYYRVLADIDDDLIADLRINVYGGNPAGDILT